MGLRDSAFMRPIFWYLEWALPGLGMFSEAYIVFSQGQVGPMQKAFAPRCFVSPYPDCDPNMVQHVYSYITICGIMAGMLLWGFLADIIGRKWGSRIVMSIMLSGCILLTFSPYAPTAYGYFAYFVTAQTWYGFGVGGEYPLASSSAAERAEANDQLRAFRGRQVALVFSNQGLGNLTNACVICACMAIFGETGATLDASGSQKVLILTYGVGSCVVAFGVFYRFVFLQESKVFKEERQVELKVLQTAAESRAILFRRHWISFKHYWPRQVAAALCWIANDFAFYGNKLQQNLFLSILFPTATSFLKQEWTILNNFIGLLGYYTAAWLIDYPWYGRRTMQIVGFMAMFVFYLIIYCQYGNMTATGNTAGAHAMQALYYLSSYFNQFGPNVTTWLVAGEIFPTDIRGTYHGFAACMGKLGAILSALWISYYASNSPNPFLISSMSGLIGAFFTVVFLPDTTGLDLSENDRMQRYLLTGRWEEYHGEALRPRHLSLWEIFVLRWHKQYNPELDAVALRMETKEAELTGQPEEGKVGEQ